MFKILIDFGGVISRDSKLFKDFGIQSGCKDPFYQGPDSWDLIENIGNKNYFKNVKEKNSFFMMCEFYPEAIETLNIFYATNGIRSPYGVFVVYDGRPNLDLSSSRIEALLASEFNRRKANINGFYVQSDKVRLCKQIGVDLMIEDDPRIAIALSSNNIKTLLMIREWNKGFDISSLKMFLPENRYKSVTENLIFVEDWVDAKYKIISLKKESL